MSVSTDVEPSCFGSEQDFGVSPTRRKKSTIKRGQAALFLFFAIFAAFSLYMVHSASSDADYQRWIAGFVISALLALYTFFHDSRRKQRRGWHDRSG